MIISNTFMNIKNRGADYILITIKLNNVYASKGSKSIILTFQLNVFL